MLKRDIIMTVRFLGNIYNPPLPLCKFHLLDIIRLRSPVSQINVPSHHFQCNLKNLSVNML